MRSALQITAVCAASFVSASVPGQNHQDPEAARQAEIEALTEAFYEFVPDFPEADLDEESFQYLSRHAERARTLAEGLEFAWSLHACDPELVAAMLDNATVEPFNRPVTELPKQAMADDNGLVLLRMMFDESTAFPTAGPIHPRGQRLSLFALWIRFDAPGDAEWNVIEPIILFDSDIAFWTHRLSSPKLNNSEHFLAVFYDGQPYIASNEYRSLLKRAVPRYDLPLRVARLRECADWLDEHGPSFWEP
ncbi:MAG: hypothetical protein ACTS27_10895 [Phycisphaerales bacterium]